MPRYLRLDFEALAASDGWKAAQEHGKTRAILQLFSAVMEKGEVPETWKRVAEIRTVGLPGKRKREAGHRETPFKPFYEAWERLWMESGRAEYVWDKKGRGAIRSLYAYTGGEVGPFEKRARKLLIDLRADKFFSANASPAFLRSRWNELSGPATSTYSGKTIAGACIRCGESGRSSVNTQEGLVCHPCYRA